MAEQEEMIQRAKEVAEKPKDKPKEKKSSALAELKKKGKAANKAANKGGGFMPDFEIDDVSDKEKQYAQKIEAY